MKNWTLLKVLLVALVLIISNGSQGLSNGMRNSDAEPEDRTSKSALVAVDKDSKSEESSDIFLSSSSEMFKPSREWQKVKPGQMIPSGLHVRLNLETGEREAKLLEENSDGQDTNSVKQLSEEMPDLENKRFTHDELKQAVKKLKISHQDTEKQSDSANQFRSLNEIKKDLKDLNMNMQTDLEILRGILKRYREDNLSPNERLSMLTDLEYYLHQIDNAKNFADMGGLALIVMDLNSTVDDIRSAAALVISSAVQSNPSVQVAAIEAGAMQQLIRMLSTDASLPVRSRSLGALSSLIRAFPFAQKKFVDLGGLQALSDILVGHSSTGGGGGWEKLCVKTVTLVTDLLNERISESSDESVSDKLHEERMRQYAQVPLLESVVERGWCQSVPQLLRTPEHDSREKVLSLMWTLRSACRQQFSHYIPALELLQQEYTKLSKQQSPDALENIDNSYFVELLKAVTDMMDAVVPAPAKDSL